MKINRKNIAKEIKSMTTDIVPSQEYYSLSKDMTIIKEVLVFNKRKQEYRNIEVEFYLKVNRLKKTDTILKLYIK